MEFVIVIPARISSTRLPRKPLINLAGKSMIQRTYERTVKAFGSEITYVATDSAEIKEHCESLGINVVKTSESCLTGTDRVAEFAELVKADFYVNVQGDEPIIDPNDIKEIVECAKQNPDSIINGYAAIENELDFRSVSIPKVVFRPDGRLMYMSRSPIPGNKGNNFQWGFRQICIYSFPAKALKVFAHEKVKSPLENEEDIEILRFLELGFDVDMVKLSGKSIAVDTQEDVNRVLKIIENEQY